MRLQIFFILCLFLGTSCTRKTLFLLPPSIQIGNYGGMDHTIIDESIISPAGQGKFLKLDVNNDGTQDLEYAIIWDGNSTLDYTARHEFFTLNENITIAVGKYNDTMYLHHDTLIYKNTGPVYNDRYRTYIFNSHSVLDSFVGINQYPYRPIAFNSLDTLKKSASFLSSKTILLEDNLNHLAFSYFSNDSIYNDWVNNEINTNPYPLNKPIYFGFSFNDNGLIRLGWIKFIIESRNKVRISETAIQSK
jgi:hypothetical protein